MHRAKSTLFAAAALTIGLAQTAFAADLPQRPAPAPLLAPTPVYNWTGIYFGINGGWGWGNQEALNLITNRFEGDSVGFLAVCLVERLAHKFNQATSS
jgi:outer membrane immunogenic protein